MKLRKAIALVAALMLVVSLFALPASAQTNDSCSGGSHQLKVTSSYSQDVNPYTVDSCSYHAGRHVHCTRQQVTNYKCNNCQYTATLTENLGTYCPAASRYV